ncbi:MAG TPA: TadE/TadG family type IV pilus assembly protein [Bryobacteraceae bacterium]|nr:TadE/TadG family type IV pilus assembly protein [Bryobacteraceae bacterium]
MKRGERGSVLVEAGFAIPLLLLLFLGIADFGRIFHHTNAAIASASQAEHVLIGSHDVQAGTGGDSSRFYTCPNPKGDDSGSRQYASPQSCPGQRTYVRVAFRVPFQAVTPHPGIPYPASAQAAAVVRIQ